MPLTEYIHTKNGKTTLPVHALSGEEFPVCVRDIQYKNPYDFTREHRHSYFEIFFFETGGGSQLIDFLEFPVKENSCYIVFPQQIHLLKRAPEACGQLIQFREEVVPSAQIKGLLRQVSFGENAAIVFENNPEKLQKFLPILKLLKETVSKPGKYTCETSLHYLQIILLQLLENKDVFQNNIASPSTEERKLLLQFQQLLEEQFLDTHTVQDFATQLNTTEKKLSATTKKHMGFSPLQVIHNRILLEAKRLLVFEDTSHKEIAYHLGFDSPASFSQFIKNKTGFTPSELSQSLVEIHK